MFATCSALERFPSLCSGSDRSSNCNQNISDHLTLTTRTAVPRLDGAVNNGLAGIDGMSDDSADSFGGLDGMRYHVSCPGDNPLSCVVITGEHIANTFQVGLMPARVSEPQWIVHTIRIPVPALRIAEIGDDVIRLDEPGKLRIVIPEVVIVEAVQRLFQRHRACFGWRVRVHFLPDE
jgi:hypothetical protein